MAPNALEIRNLKKQYGTLWAVNDVSFDVEQGRVFSFLGPNGAGKTTTVEMIEGIRRPTAGSIRVLGREQASSMDWIKEEIGVLPQQFTSFERLTVRETLMYFGDLYSRRADVDELIARVNLMEKADEMYKNLSGGLKQRVGIAVSLVNDPKIVFLDEPTTGLDPRARRDVWKVISGLRQAGKTVFLTTHYMEEAEVLSDHVAIIHRGRIIASGSPTELVDRYGKRSHVVIRGCDTVKAGAVLRKLKLVPQASNGGTCSAPVADKEHIFQVLAAIKDSNIPFRQVDIQRPTLEEVFLNLTGAKLGAEDEEGAGE